MAEVDRPAPSRAQLPRSALLFVLAAALLLAACGRHGGAPEITVGDAVVGIQAEAIAGQGPFTTGEDAAAAEARFAVQEDAGDPAGEGELAAIPFVVEAEGEYSLWARALGVDADADAFAAGFDGQVTRAVAPEVGAYRWVLVERTALRRGEHRISVGSGEAGTRLDMFALASDPEMSEGELDQAVFGGEPPGTPEEPAPDAPTGPEPEPEPDPAPAEPQPRAAFSLRGVPEFDPNGLTASAREWHERLHGAIEASAPRMLRYAEDDDMYQFGRTLFQYDSALLLALRSTGDLRFLDAVDEVMEAVRDQLHDGWCGDVDDELYVNGNYGTIEEDDGFLNFRRRGIPDHRNHCRDVGDLNETLTHGHLAMVMYAYHVNRDLESPAGIDYGARADFWLDYLRNHFEAKWRGRSDTAWPDMDFIDLKFCHTYNQFALYHYFIGKRLQEEGDPDSASYLGRAKELTDGMFDVPYEQGEHSGGFMEVDTPAGEAVVYSFGSPGWPYDDVKMEACPSTYARYTNSSLLALRLERFHRWDDDIMTKLAVGIGHFMMDTDAVASRSDPFAAGVSGSREVAGILPTEYRDRLSLGKYAETLFGVLAAWDETGRIADVSSQAYHATEGEPDHPSQVFIPSSALFVEVYDGPEGSLRGIRP